jgi:probable rRNA maturation factor
VAEQNLMFDITVEVDPPYAGEVDAEHLIEVATHVLHQEGIPGPIDLSIWITNEAEIQTLNRTYRNVDAATDVLSFGSDDDEDTPFVQAPGIGRHLGDIAISFPHVVRQAEEYGHSRNRELSYLLVHGVLHLIGYDHEDAADAKQMREHEETALGILGITRGGDNERDTSRP